MESVFEKYSPMVGYDFFLAELARRQADRQTGTMLDLTDTIRLLTWVVAIFTAVGVATSIAAIIVAATH